MRRDDEDPIGSLVVDIEQEHPRPRTEDKASRRPSSLQLRPRKGERFKNPQGADNPAPGISRKAQPRNGVIHIPLRTRADDHLCPSGQLVEWSTFPAPRLGEPLLRTLPSAGNCVENLRDAAGIRICIV